MNKRSKACSFGYYAKLNIRERDNHQCVMCGDTNPYHLTYAHYISRANGGLGIEENGVLLCMECHRETDQSIKRKSNLAIIREYLKKWYPYWSEDELKYRKGVDYEKTTNHRLRTESLVENESE